MATPVVNALCGGAEQVTQTRGGAEQVTQAWSAVWTRAAMLGSVMGYIFLLFFASRLTRVTMEKAFS